VIREAYDSALAALPRNAWREKTRLRTLKCVLNSGGTAWLAQQWTSGARFTLLDKPDSGTQDAPGSVLQNTFEDFLRRALRGNAAIDLLRA